MVAGAVNTELFITINVSRRPSNLADYISGAGDDLTATPDVRGASESPEGSEVAAEHVAGGGRAPDGRNTVRSVAEIFCSRWRQRRIDVVTADRGATRTPAARRATSL